MNKDASRAAVLPNTTYTLTGWVKTNGVTAPAGEGAYYAIGFADNAGNWLGVSTYTNVVTGTQGWNLVSVTVTSPANAASATVSARLNGAGTAWFDDVTLN